MFSFVTDASKVALVHLVARLRLGRFRLLDTQFVTAHLTQFGAREIPRGLYKAQLADALRAHSQWPASIDPEALAAEIRNLGARKL
jgi:leucyl/phenylalanyl-tRNA--protein transferase